MKVLFLKLPHGYPGNQKQGLFSNNKNKDQEFNAWFILENNSFDHELYCAS